MTKRAAMQPGERRQVTVAFLDLVGYSDLASTSDAEDLQDWLDRYYIEVRDIVEACGGQVTAYIGDGVVAVFGLEQADEFAAPRAVDAAMQVVAQVYPGPEGGEPLRIRGGIATGEIVVRGSAGGPNLTGGVFTLAERIQSQATPGTVLMAESTRRVLRSASLRSRLVKETRLKGFAEPQRLYAPTQAETAADAGTGDILVGRDADCAAIAAADRPVLITGPAGIGKSTLLRHLPVARAGNVAVFQGDALHGSSSYRPFRQWLNARLGMADADAGALRAAFPDLSPDDLQGLALVFGLPEGQALQAEVSGPALRRRIEQALARTIAAAVPGATLIFEDLHWYDTASLGAVAHLLQHEPVLPILMSAREASLLRDSLPMDRLEEHALAPLPDSAAAGLLEALGDGDLPKARAERLIRRAGGIPLFLRHLLDRARNGEGSDEDIPDTLTDLLAERIDRTGPARPVLQRAAILGRTFDVPLLARVLDGDDDPLPLLARAEEAGVVARVGDDRWTFTHALLVDASYRSLLRSQREVLHGRVADLLQTDDPGLAARDPAMLATHLMRARRLRPAIQCLLAAGRLAFVQSAYADAEAHLRTAVNLLKDLDDGPETDDLAIECYTALGSILMQSLGFSAPPVREALDEVHRIAEARPSASRDRSPALMGSFTNAIIAGSADKADAFLALLGDLERNAADPGPDDEIRLAHLACRNGAAFYKGDFAEQFDHIARIREGYSLATHAPLIARYSMDIFATAQMFEAPARAICGQVDRVDDLVAETDAHQEALNIPLMLPYALCWGAVPLFYAGRRDAAIDRLDRGIALADRQEAAFWQITGRIWRHMMHTPADGPAPIEALATAISQLRAMGAGIGVTYFEATLADWMARDGRIDAARDLAARASQACRASRLLCWYPEILRLRSTVETVAGHPEIADQLRTEAAETATKQGAILWDLRIAMDAGDRDRIRPLLAALPDNARLPEADAAEAQLA